MTESVIAQDQPIPIIPAIPSSDPSITSNPEPMLPQSHANRIVGAARQEAREMGYQKGYETAKKEFESQQAPSVQMPNGYVAPNSQATNGMGGMQTFNRQDVERMVAEAVPNVIAERSKRESAERLLQDFTQKVATGASKYNDFDQKVSKLRLDLNPHLVILANQTDNPADVLYDLAENPYKVGNLLNLANNAGTQHLASEHMQTISSSIKANQTAIANAASAKEPLSQLKPSASGTDGGEMTVSDYMKIFR